MRDDRETGADSQAAEPALPRDAKLPLGLSLLTKRTILGNVADGRDNNFNLIRFLAAVAVLVSHAWPITQGPGVVEPLHNLLGYTLGEIAVFIFFALSGYFIAGSYVRLRSGGAFVRARAARLFPGLFVSLVLVAFLMGPVVSSLPLTTYVTDPETTLFIARNLALLTPQYSLPGVFETLPYPTVEGSIWTLVHEAICYGLVLLIGLSGLLMRRRAMLVAMLAFALIWALPLLSAIELHPRVAQTRMLSFPFMVGVAIWVWRDRIVLSLPILALVTATSIATQGTVLAFVTLVFALSYLVFWLGHIPQGVIRQFNRVGDYSYGIYIYAFPLQGLTVWIWGPMSPVQNIVLALPMTLLFAVLSWHLVERPALDFARTGIGKFHFLFRQS